MGNTPQMDMEWAKDGISGELFIVQARPETVQSQRRKNVLRSYHLPEATPAKPLLKGRSVGAAIGQAQSRILDVQQNSHVRGRS